MCPPYGAIICHRDAHIEVDEAGAPAFFADGAKLMLVDGPGAKVAPDAVDAAVGRIRKDVHQVQPKALSITNATEYGLAYSAAEVGALGEAAKRHGLAFHIDGARFANAVVSTGASPADLSWRAGVDAMSFGFVKNGGLNAEALILFRTELADEIAVRRKRAGHLLSKGRMVAAQILAMLEDDLWLDNARAANAAAQTIAKAARRPARSIRSRPMRFSSARRRRRPDRFAPRASTSTTGRRTKSASSPAGTKAAKPVDQLAAAIAAL